MKLNSIHTTIASITMKPGDVNPNVKVAHIETTCGLTFTCTKFLDNKINSEHFPTPYASLTKVKKETNGVLFFGKANGYAHPTFVGFVPLS